MATPKTTPPTSEADDAALHAMIAQDPNEPGRHNARLVPSGTQVRSVLAALQGNKGDIARTAAEWHLPEDAVRAAIRYYERHRELFDAYFLLQREEYEADDG
jgi:uncharacterized protein (DUF433 family)